MLPTKLLFIWLLCFRGEDFFRNYPIRNKNFLWWPWLWTDWDEIINLYRGPSIDASYPVSVHLAKRFQRRRFFRTQPIRNKNCLWQSCFLTNRAEMSNLYKGPYIDVSYQVSVHLVKRFQKKIFLEILLYQVHLAWTWIKFTTLVVIDTDCIGSYKSNYHMTMATTIPI